jgi:hypothetical protein
MDKLTSRRAFFLRLLRRKLAQDLDDMGYPGGHMGAERGSRTGEIIQAREQLENQAHEPTRRRALQR